jgi:hypothetical protein
VKIKTKIKSGGIALNHNQTRLRIKSGVKAGGGAVWG